MMKSLVSTTVFSFALTVSAFAADLPYTKASPIAPPPPPAWNGFYAGVNVGGLWSDSLSITNVAGPISDFSAAGGGGSWAGMASVAASGALNMNGGSGFIGGGQVGYNYQFDPGGFGSWLVGFEADIQGLAGNSSSANMVSAVGPFAFLGGAEVHTAGIYGRASLDYIGTVRGRMGWVFTPTFLVYGTGGLAYGGANASTSISEFNNDCSLFPAFCVQATAGTTGSYSDARAGWTIGGGLEWMFLPNWSAKVEYLHYDLGTAHWNNALLAFTSNTFPDAGGPAGIASQATTRFNGNIVRAGVNYHFNWAAPAPVLAKY